MGLQATQQIRPHTPSPASGTARSNLAKTNLRAYSSKMVSHSVNKTALHPGGVEPGREHTELEEELHTTAHIDYDRVAIVANPSVSALYEDALVYETGTAITSSGALSAYSGNKTGRSPLDKRVVKEESSEKDEWYRISVRVVCARAYHALFMRNMLIRPSREELQNFHPDYVIYNAGSFPANRYTTGMTSATSVAINFAEKEM